MKLFKSAVALSLSALAVTTSYAQKKIKYEEFDLDNGIHVILHENNTAPIVAVSVLYHVGSKNEKPNRTGFAHFFEHLLFEGSENIDRGQYDKIVKNAGGALNANTSQDRTYYYELLPSNQLELGLWLESERMLHAKVDNKGIETQREVVKEEKRMRVDNQPYGTIHENAFKNAFKEHPYRWMPIGSMADLDAAEEEDYINFYDTFYVPNNAVISIAGDINIKEAKEWVKKYFASIPSGDKLIAYRDIERLEVDAVTEKYSIENKEDFKVDLKTLSTEAILEKYFTNVSSKLNEVPTTSIIEPALGEEIVDTVYDNIQLPMVLMAYRTPEQNSKDAYAVDMLISILSSGQSSRLNKSIVDEKQLAVATGAFQTPLEDPGLTFVIGVANAGVDFNEVQDALDIEITDLKTNLISDREFQKLQNRLEAQFISANSSVAGIAESLANYYVYYDGQTNLINDEVNNYLAVTKEDILRVANEYFNVNNRVVLYYLPKQ